MKEAPLAKLTRPTVKDIHSRDRLLDLFDEALERPITWVSAPAGSGKTTTVASYLAARRLPSLWYQVDDGDADIANLFYYMGIAEKRAYPGKRRSLPLLTAEYLETISTFTRRYFEDLFSRLKPPYAIVFDNYQDVPDSARFHQLIRTGLEMLPDGVKVIAISRVAPHMEFARIRANNKMSRVGWEDLRFSLTETRDLLHKGKNKGYSDDHIGRLHTITDGWVAGIVLLAEGSNLPDFARSGEGIGSSGIFDYFASEVFRRVDGETRDFLIKTSFLPQVEPSLAGKLTGVRNPGAILLSLNKENFFTTNYRQDSAVYQYHPLFKEFLQAKARESLGDVELVEVKRLAASLLDEVGRPVDAVELLINVGDWRAAGVLMTRHAAALLSQGRTATVKGWLDRLPAEIIEGEPYLSFWLGLCLASINPAEGRRCLEKAFKMFREDGDRAGMLLSLSRGADLAVYEGEYQLSDHWIDLMEEVLAEDGSFPSADVEAAVTMSMFNAMALRQPYHPNIVMWEEKAFKLLLGDGDENLRGQTGMYLSFYHVWAGNFSKARVVVDMLNEIGRSSTLSDLVRLAVKLMVSHYHLLTASFDESMEDVYEGVRIADESGVRIFECHQICHGLSVALCKGDFEEFDRLRLRMEASIGTARNIDVAYYYGVLAWRHLLLREFASAVEYQKIVIEKFGRSGFREAVSMATIAMAEIYRASGDLKKASEYLLEAYEIIAVTKSRYQELMCLLVDAKISFDFGQEGPGLKALEKSLAIGAEKGFWNMYYWDPVPMAGLCVKALEAGIETAYVRQLIQKRGLSPEAPPVHLEDWPWPVRIKTLGEFRLYRGEEAVEPSRKTQQKPLHMLKAIISQGGKGVDEEHLSDLLWPDADGDAAHNAFTTTLSRLRQLVGVEGAVVLKEGKVSLDPHKVWVDAWAFEAICADAQAAIDGGRQNVGKAVDRALGVYKGQFLPHDADQPWTAGPRERYRDRFLRLVINAGRHMERAGDYEKAAGLYYRGLEVDALYEELYQHLMLCCHKLERRSEAISLYNRCKESLKLNLGINPSGKTESIYKKVISE